MALPHPLRRGRRRARAAPVCRKSKVFLVILGPLCLSPPPGQHVWLHLAHVPALPQPSFPANKGLCVTRKPVYSRPPLEMGSVVFMKKEIHPEYSDATITCACGNEIHTRSTVKEMQVNTCSACHPFYTGKATLIDAEGRVEKFRKRYGQK